jgi:amidase
MGQERLRCRVRLSDVGESRRKVQRWWTEGWDLLITPILSEPPVEIGEHEATDEGLPIGVQVVAAFGREDLLLAVASQLESAHPRAQRLPTLA